MLLPCGHCICKQSILKVIPRRSWVGFWIGGAGCAASPSTPSPFHTLAPRPSLLQIAKAANRQFKCPYCPAECSPQQCRELHFP